MDLKELGRIVKKIHPAGGDSGLFLDFLPE